MHLSEHSLRLLYETYLRSLDLEALRYLSARLLADLKEARARLDARSAGRSLSPQRPASSVRQRAALAEFIETCRRAAKTRGALSNALSPTAAPDCLSPLYPQ